MMMRAGWGCRAVVAGAMVVVTLTGAASAQSAGDAGATLTPVAAFERDQVTGVAVTSGGRVFACMPLWHDGHRLHVVEVKPDGSYAAYPNAVWNSWNENVVADTSQRFICVQSLRVDDRDRLWALDGAAPRMKGPVAGGAKLVELEPGYNRVKNVIRFNTEVAPEGSYLNDVRIDSARGYAYVTDSGLGAIIVTNLNTNKSRRLLAEHESTKAEKDVVPVVNGIKLIRDGKPMRVHSDGIALDARGEYLYWQALTGRTLYRIATEKLRDANLTEEEVGAAVEKVGETVVTDGMEMDAAGNIYFTAIEQNAIVVRSPDGTMSTLAQDQRLVWPDTMAFGPGNALYVTTSRINESEWFAAEGARLQGPYGIWRMNRR
ncbi:MAG TPA: L-dopachrome tautomerase-related protein [Phycisphaerales bacterium]|nr:L-dopachrome tautomerase-related protein [Phycisphaerales bacterium]